MMKSSMLIGALLAVGLAMAGCEKSETTTPASSGGGASGTAATPAASPSAAAPSTPTPAENASASTPAPAATPESATAAAQSAAQSAQTAAGTAAPTTAPSAAATPEVQQAQTLLNQTVQYIKENKMDLAEKGLTQLEALKPKLPVEYQTKIDSARKAFNAAKTGQGLKLDSVLPGSGK